MSKGTHLIVDCSGISYEKCVNDKFLLETLMEATKATGANIINTSRYRFGYDSPAGCSVFIMLDESHISIHTYADEGKMALDIFTCGTNIDCKRILTLIARTLNIQKMKTTTIERFLDGKKMPIYKGYRENELRDS